MNKSQSEQFEEGMSDTKATGKRKATDAVQEGKDQHREKELNGSVDVYIAMNREYAKSGARPECQYVLAITENNMHIILRATTLEGRHHLEKMPAKTFLRLTNLPAPHAHDEQRITYQVKTEISWSKIEPFHVKFEVAAAGLLDVTAEYPTCSDSHSRNVTLKGKITSINAERHADHDGKVLWLGNTVNIWWTPAINDDGAYHKLKVDDVVVFANIFQPEGMKPHFVVMPLTAIRVDE